MVSHFTRKRTKATTLGPKYMAVGFDMDIGFSPTCEQSTGMTSMGR